MPGCWIKNAVRKKTCCALFIYTHRCRLYILHPCRLYILTVLTIYTHRAGHIYSSMLTIYYCCPLKVKYDQNLLANIDYMGVSRYVFYDFQHPSPPFFACSFGCLLKEANKLMERFNPFLWKLYCRGFEACFWVLVK